MSNSYCCKWVALIHDDQSIVCPFINMDEPLRKYCYYCRIPEEYKMSKENN